MVLMPGFTMMLETPGCTVPPSWQCLVIVAWFVGDGESLPPNSI